MTTSETARDAALLEAIDTSSTMDLHRSNLLRMQISELLEECHLDMENQKWSGQANDYLQRLSKFVRRTPVIEKAYQDLSDKPVAVKIPASDDLHLSIEPIGCTKTRLGWTKRAGNANVLPTFDLLVQIPTEVFASKDFMHHRYFDKRSVVVKTVAEALEKNSDVFGTVEYVWTKGMNRPPIVRLQPPRTNKAAKFQVHLHFGMKSIDWIPRLRLVPNRSNIKDKGMKAQLYNHQLLCDARHEFEDDSIELADHKSCQETLVLLQVWALQRGLWRNHDGWNANAVALLIVFLLRSHKINPRMSAIQVFTVVLQTWASTNWLGDEDTKKEASRAAQSEATQMQGGGNCARDILVLPPTAEKGTFETAPLSSMYAKQTLESPLSASDPPTLGEAYSWTSCYQLGPVFLDPSMTHNYIGDVSPNYTRLLQDHARKSLQALKNSRSAFEYLFMKSARFWFQWDVYIRVPVDIRGPTNWEFSTRGLLDKLEMGLGNRINGLRVLSTGNGDTSSSAYNTDQYPKETIGKGGKEGKDSLGSPIGAKDIVVGFSVNPETSRRLVDRGPPSDDTDGVRRFLELWGEKAQLRRFKDGAIVHAAVWNDDPKIQMFQNGDKWNGGYVAEIAKHLIRCHYTAQKVSVSFPILLSAIDGISVDQGSPDIHRDPWTAHQNIIKSFDKLSTFLREKSVLSTTGRLQSSTLNLPIPIDAVEALSPCLRYSELFPPEPHSTLGGSSMLGKRYAGARMSDPVLIQIRFGPSSKWPTDFKAVGAAKTAMLVQLANGIENSGNKDFDGPIIVCPTYADINYQGYRFRILVRADPEIRMLQRLESPTAVALELLDDLTKKHVLAARHHSTVHAVHTLNPSSAAVVRIAKRWIACHLLSGHIPVEAIELIVAKIFSDGDSPLESPGTVMSGFIRFLHLLANHDWAREPLIVNPRSHISDDEYDEIYRVFAASRGKSKSAGPPMYIIAPYNAIEVEQGKLESHNAASTTKEVKWYPSVPSPEWVVLTRAVHLAKRSVNFMRQCLMDFNDTDWSATFNESPTSFKSYDVLFRVGTDFIIDSEISSTGGNLGLIQDDAGRLETSYTRSTKARVLGPKALRQKAYRNLRPDISTTLIYTWHPVMTLFESLQHHFGNQAVFFFNEYCPEVIGLVWRPKNFTSGSFSVLASEFSCPVDDVWTSDSLVAKNVGDLLREMSQHFQDMVTNVRIFDDKCVAHFSKKLKIDHTMESGNESP